MLTQCRIRRRRALRQLYSAGDSDMVRSKPVRCAGLVALALTGCQHGSAPSPDLADDFDRSIDRSIYARSEGGPGVQIRPGANGAWNASLSGNGQPRTISSASCLGLLTAMEDFDGLPPVTGGWPRPSGDPPTLPIPPTRKHGATWRFQSPASFRIPPRFV